VTTLSTLFKNIVPVWLVAVGLFAVFQLPMTFATAMLLFVVGVVPPLVMFVLSSRHSPTVAEVLHHAEGSRTER
jgi:hypothetical protein